MFWFSLHGIVLGGLCGALIGAVTPPRVGRAMLLGYMAVGILSFLGLLGWFGRGQFNNWMESPIGGGSTAMNQSFLAWPLSIFLGLVAAAVAALIAARPWRGPSQRLLSWVGVATATLPLLLPGLGANWLYAAEREGQAFRQADDDRRDKQLREEAQKLEQEKARLRAGAQRLAGTLGELQYPGATPAALAADGMSFTCNTNDPLTAVVTYYERLLGRRFRMRPANDGGSSPFYNDSIMLNDSREVYVYIEPPTAPSVASRITLAPL